MDLLAPEGTVVKRALYRHKSPRHASTRASCRWTARGRNFSGLRVVEIVEEVRLATCERVVTGHKKARLQGILLRGHPHGRGKKVELKVQEDGVEDGRDK